MRLRNKKIYINEFVEFLQNNPGQQYYAWLYYKQWYAYIKTYPDFVYMINVDDILKKNEDRF